MESASQLIGNTRGEGIKTLRSPQFRSRLRWARIELQKMDRDGDGYIAGLKREEEEENNDW